ncbi:hypothetical protein GCM10022223_31480 [Kineosporia mesophila]|uniref:D-alanyl-D-alanine carboxypeptidase-like core domain-containing protein n=1 Tax=Kineosporia mesophila TaxID=566012 RepID=A0ABP6ZND8_9ACTN
MTVLAVLVPGTAAAAPSASGPTSSGGAEREPTPAELAAQAQKVTTLRELAQARAGSVKSARQASAAAALLAGQALEAYTTARRALEIAQEQEDRLDDELRIATTQARAAGERVGFWARQSYQSGSGLNASPMLNTLLGTNGGGQDADGFTTTLYTLRRIGESRAADLSAGRRARARAEKAAADATRATGTALAAARTADEARTTADNAVARQQRILDDAQAALGSSRGRVRTAEKKERQLRAALQSERSPDPAANVVTGVTGSCTADVTGYPNGEIPLTALCALATAPGQYLRADAAYAFDQLSTAYAQQFGTPICVTDSYRDYATQVRLYATKPQLAARPGTSNHGWGTATDLCGGVQHFGTPEHEWLFVNAPVFGWFHPAWAQPGGSRPEPWHWEFGG